MASASVQAGTQLSALQIAQLARGAGFTGSGLVTAIAVALEESGGWTRATFTNSDQWRSVDRGLWQFNNHWHPEISDDDAFTPAAAARHAYRVSAGGADWSQWSAVKSGAISKTMAAAQAAAAGVDARSPATGATVQFEQAPIGPAVPGASMALAVQDDSDGPHMGLALMWALRKAGMSDANALWALGAAYEANGKKDGFYLHDPARATPTLWPTMTAAEFNAVGAKVATNDASTQLVTGRLTGQALIARAVGNQFGRSSLGNPARDSVLWAQAQLDELNLAPAGWDPFHSPPADPNVPGGGLLGDFNGVTAVKDAAGNVVGYVVDAITSPLTMLKALIAFVMNPETWKRLGLIVGGGLVLVLGVGLFEHAVHPGQITATAATAAKVAAV